MPYLDREPRNISLYTRKLVWPLTAVGLLLTGCSSTNPTCELTTPPDWSGYGVWANVPASLTGDRFMSGYLTVADKVIDTLKKTKKPAELDVPIGTPGHRIRSMLSTIPVVPQGDMHVEISFAENQKGKCEVIGVYANARKVFSR